MSIKAKAINALKRAASIPGKVMGRYESGFKKVEAAKADRDFKMKADNGLLLKERLDAVNDAVDRHQEGKGNKITEDMPEWDPKTMGNKKGGPMKPVEADYGKPLKVNHAVNNVGKRLVK